MYDKECLLSYLSHGRGQHKVYQSFSYRSCNSYSAYEGYRCNHLQIDCNNDAACICMSHLYGTSALLWHTRSSKTYNESEDYRDLIVYETRSHLVPLSTLYKLLPRVSILRGFMIQEETLQFRIVDRIVERTGANPAVLQEDITVLGLIFSQNCE